MASTRVQVGDLIVVHGHRVGDSGRTGQILELLGSGEHEHYRVLWEDGHESLFTPGSDSRIQHIERPDETESVLIHEP